MSPVVVLVGLPGVGKTSTGMRLAKILAVPFADSDELVEHAEGRRVREIFAAAGETAFRAAEAAAVVEALNTFDGVLSLGGGALGAAETRAEITASGVPVVVLRAQLDTLSTRVGNGRSRPLLSGAPRERLEQLAAERGPLFAQLATFTVDTDGKTHGQVAATIAARLHGRRRQALA